MYKDSKSNGTFEYQTFQTNEALTLGMFAFCSHHAASLNSTKWTISHQ